MAEDKKQNSMKDIRIEKITVNCGCGTDHTRLEKSVKLVERLTGKKTVRTTAKLRVATWNLRKGLPIGVKTTIRGKDETAKLLKRLLYAKDNIISKRCFDEKGNVSFGIPEYIDIDGIEYDPEIGIIGLQVSITLERPGYRVKKRALPTRVGKTHIISQEDAVAYFKKEYDVKLAEEIEDEE